MSKTDYRLLARFLLTGLLSAVICWAGSYVIPENTLIARIYPGIVLGLALAVLGYTIDVQPRNRWWLSALLLVAASIIGWRLAVDIGFDMGGPLPFTAAGAIGALSVAVGLLLAWPDIRRRVLFAAIVMLGGTAGGLIFRFINAVIDDSSEGLWIFLLFAEWQIALLLAIWLALGYEKIPARIQ